MKKLFSPRVQWVFPTVRACPSRNGGKVERPKHVGVVGVEVVARQDAGHLETCSASSDRGFSQKTSWGDSKRKNGNHEVLKKGIWFLRAPRLSLIYKLTESDDTYTKVFHQQLSGSVVPLTICRNLQSFGGVKCICSFRFSPSRSRLI